MITLCLKHKQHFKSSTKKTKQNKTSLKFQLRLELEVTRITLQSCKEIKKQLGQKT